ncbi:MAG: hypothetical protein ACOYKZ_04465 [Chlamydiia bacterium]
MDYLEGKRTVHEVEFKVSHHTRPDELVARELGYSSACLVNHTSIRGCGFKGKQTEMSALTESQSEVYFRL